MAIYGLVSVSAKVLTCRVVGSGRVYFYAYIMYTGFYFKSDMHLKQNAPGHLKINILNDLK